MTIKLPIQGGLYSATENKRKPPTALKPSRAMTHKKKFHPTNFSIPNRGRRSRVQQSHLGELKYWTVQQVSLRVKSTYCTSITCVYVSQGCINLPGRGGTEDAHELHVTQGIATSGNFFPSIRFTRCVSPVGCSLYVLILSSFPSDSRFSKFSLARSSNFSYTI